ncbi:TIR domain-containing protein [Pseudomonas sp. LW8]|jgi:predicted nucleotide-binding protein|uniref:TIR domain-containing protein n=1 Tax=Pseudomonas sp. LW8 TaxID=3242677 RepID=UPI0035BEEF62
MKPKLFIGSSVEGLEVAYAVQQNLNHEAEATVWTQGIFELSKSTMDSLSDSMSSADFGVFLFTPDDITTIRENTNKTARDNVIFELGLFIGKLGRERVFFITPEDTELHIPTDLLGITPGKYSPNRSDKNLSAATGAACNQIRIQIKKLGNLHPIDATKNTVNTENKEETIDDWVADFAIENYKLAKNKLEKLIKTSSGEKQLEYKTWSTYADLSLELKGAKEELIKIFNSSHNFDSIQSLIPKIFIWSGYSKIATELASKAFERAPENAVIIESLAHCYENEGLYEEAISTISNSTLSTTPNLAIKLAALLKNSDNNKESLKTLYKSYRENPSDTSITYSLALAFQETNYKKEALSLFSALVNREDSNANYWGYLSNACLNLDLYDKAMSACKKAVEVSQSKTSWILFNVGNMFNNKGFYTESIDWLNRGIMLSKNAPYGHERLATALKNQKDEQDKYEKNVKEGRALVNNFEINDLQ